MSKKQEPTTGELGVLDEDGVKRHLKAWLDAQGLGPVTVAWGHARGVDITAKHRDGRRWLIEVKGPGSRPEMRVNYFLAILGEALQRMDDPSAAYSIAFPDLPQFRGLWDRLPGLAKERTGITALFVTASGSVSQPA